MWKSSTDVNQNIGIFVFIDDLLLHTLYSVDSLAKSYFGLFFDTCRVDAERHHLGG